MARYQELDSLNPVSKHDPDFDRKRFEYISQTGIDPVTGKKADKDFQNYAKNYVKHAPTIQAAYYFLMVGVAAWNMNAYNKKLQAQKADEINKIFQDALDADAAKKVENYYQKKDYYRKKFEFYGNNTSDSEIPVVDNSGQQTVGRWMSTEEYTKMIDSGKVQMSPNGNTTYVAVPSDIDAFPAAKPGSVFTEFDVNSQYIYSAGKEGWGQIPGPGSLIDRLNQKKGLPPITEMPDAHNINIKGEK